MTSLHSAVEAPESKLEGLVQKLLALRAEIDATVPELANYRAAQIQGATERSEAIEVSPAHEITRPLANKQPGTAIENDPPEAIALPETKTPSGHTSVAPSSHEPSSIIGAEQLKLCTLEKGNGGTGASKVSSLDGDKTPTKAQAPSTDKKSFGTRCRPSRTAVVAACMAAAVAAGVGLLVEPDPLSRQPEPAWTLELPSYFP